MANAAQTPKLQIGKLSPEDAERLASTFRPIWELDDAPFAQGSALSAADIDSLAAGAGVAPSVRGVQQEQPQPPRQVAVDAKPVAPSNPGHVPAPDAPKVEIAVDLDPADLVSATPPPAKAAPSVAQAAPQAATVRKPYTPPRPPPETVNMRDAAMGTGDFVPVKKSNTGLIIGGVAVLAIVGAVIGVKMMGGNKTESATTSTSQTSPGHEETTHIPPPPEVAATQEQTQPAPTHTQAPPAAKTNDAPIVKEFPTTAPTHTQQTATNVTAPVHTATHTTSGGGGHASGGGTKPGGKPAIVRDNPF